MRPTRLSPLQASAGKNKPRRRRRRTTTTEPVKENTFATEEQQRQQHDVGEDDDDDDDDDDDMEIISEKEELSVEKPTGYEFQPPKADPAISSPYCKYYLIHQRIKFDRHGCNARLLSPLHFSIE